MASINATTSKTRSGRRKRGFVLILLAFFVAIVLGGVGLAVDAACLFIVKSKLTAACDAASLAAARNLNVGQTMTAQADAARTRAQSYYAANFPQQFLGATRSPAVINIPTNTPGNVLTVTTTGQAVANTYFMHFFGTPSVVVRARGTASRRDVNMMMVLDRSNSLNLVTPESCTPMRNAATDFVGKFADGRDRVGLITFGSNVVMAFPPARNFKSAGTNIADLIATIRCGDNTATTSAYWLAYQQLLSLNEPGALNVIVLFTDGVPNGVTARFTKKSGSPCRNSTMDGTMVALGGFLPGGRTAGIYKVNGRSIANHGEEFTDNPNCSFRSDEMNAQNDVTGFPDLDIYGNSLRNYGSDYVRIQGSDMLNGKIRADNNVVVGKISKNTLDHAAMRVRSDTRMRIVTFVIGLGSYSAAIDKQPDDVLMRRITNDPDGLNDPNSVFVQDPNVPEGRYYRATDNGGMAEAFQRIASEVLRLSR